MKDERLIFTFILVHSLVYVRYLHVLKDNKSKINFLNRTKSSVDLIRNHTLIFFYIFPLTNYIYVYNTLFVFGINFIDKQFYVMLKTLFDDDICKNFSRRIRNILLLIALEVQKHSRESKKHSREDRIHSRESKKHSREDRIHSRESKKHSCEDRIHSRETKIHSHKDKIHVDGSRREGQNCH
jgi:hypothetical protein